MLRDFLRAESIEIGRDRVIPMMRGNDGGDGRGAEVIMGRWVLPGSGRLGDLNLFSQVLDFIEYH